MISQTHMLATRRGPPSRMEVLYTWLMFPVYAVQGLSTRARVPRMTPPVAPERTHVPGQGEPIHVLVIGDSSAAGVGVDRFEDCFAGNMGPLLAKQTGRPVTVMTSGNNSATCGQVCDCVVPNLERYPYDYVLLNIGINDSKNFHTGRRFCKEFGSLIYALRARFPGAAIAWSGLIDLEDVPALPQPLARIIGIRSRLLRRNAQELCTARGAFAPNIPWQSIPENFASDGFHASSEGYRSWAASMAEWIANRESGRVRDIRESQSGI